MMRFYITTVAVTILIGAALATNTVYAGNDWNDICRDAGYGHGQNGPFSEDTYDHCGYEKDGDGAFYKGFIDGCMSIEGNTKDVCESATD